MKSDAERQRVIQCLEAAIQRRVSEVRTNTSRLTVLFVSSSIDLCRCCSPSPLLLFLWLKTASVRYHQNKFQLLRKKSVLDRKMYFLLINECST